MAHIKLGNGMPVELVRAGDTAMRQPIVMPEGADHVVTDVHVPDGAPIGDVLRDITAVGGVWEAHSDHDAPLWVSSDDPNLTALLVAHFGCDKRPWREAHSLGEPSGPAPKKED